MVELCELNLMNCGDDYWPAGKNKLIRSYFCKLVFLYIRYGSACCKP